MNYFIFTAIVALAASKSKFQVEAQPAGNEHKGKSDSRNADSGKAG